MSSLRVFIGILMLGALTTSALAADGCDKFAWPLAREQTLLAAADKPSVKAGETLAAIPQAAFTLHLQPGTDAAFVMPPEYNRRPNTGSAARSSLRRRQSPASIK